MGKIRHVLLLRVLVWALLHTRRGKDSKLSISLIGDRNSMMLTFHLVQVDGKEIYGHCSGEPFGLGVFVIHGLNDKWLKEYDEQRIKARGQASL